MKINPNYPRIAQDFEGVEPERKKEILKHVQAVGKHNFHWWVPAFKREHSDKENAFIDALFAPESQAEQVSKADE